MTVKEIESSVLNTLLTTDADTVYFYHEKSSLIAIRETFLNMFSVYDGITVNGLLLCSIWGDNSFQFLGTRGYATSQYDNISPGWRFMGTSASKQEIQLEINAAKEYIQNSQFRFTAEEL